ncbi:MAG: TolC family protein, partial [Bacteroidales bacterium]|nr:TolC family protein [Bacteroidales bacterium]
MTTVLAVSLHPADSVPGPTPITLEQAIQIAVTESPTVKVADLEIEKTGYARKGTYSSLFPTIDGSGAYQRTIKKQVMYMDFDMGAMGGGAGTGTDEAGAATDGTSAVGGEGTNSPVSPGGGIEVGRWNTWNAGVTAAMPLVNAQLWESLKISDMDVELAVEKARSSRIETVTQVKQAYFGVLLARQAFEVYKSVYENALENLELIQKRYNVQKASELELARAKTTLANAIPNVYDAENSIVLGLWQLKAVMGIDLDANIDVVGSLNDYGTQMLYDMSIGANADLADNSTMRQLAIQAEQLASSIKLQQKACLPTLSLAFSYSLNAMTNDFKFDQYRWTPYSYVGLSLNIPIFAGGKRSNAIKQSRVQASQLKEQTISTERQLKISIRQYLNTMETAVKSHGSAVNAAETAQKAYDIARKSYEVGRSTLTDLNDA